MLYGGLICKQCGVRFHYGSKYTLCQGPACFSFCGEPHADEWAAARLRSFSGGPPNDAHAASGHAVDRLCDADSAAMPVPADTKLPHAALLS